MTRLGALLILLAGLLWPGIAYAETIEWEAVHPTKGIFGQDGVRCEGWGTSTTGDVTVHYTNWIGADADEMSSNPKRERAWQQSECEHDVRQDIQMILTWSLVGPECDKVGKMQYPPEGVDCRFRNLTLDPSTVKTKVTRV